VDHRAGNLTRDDLAEQTICHATINELWEAPEALSPEAQKP
jgi:hypothetical protein